MTQPPICLVCESTDFDPKDTRYYLCDDCRARQVAAKQRRSEQLGN